jgi:hypothetical protein
MIYLQARSRLVRPLLMSLKALTRFSLQLDEVLAEIPFALRPFHCANREQIDVEARLLGLRQALHDGQSKTQAKPKVRKCCLQRICHDWTLLFCGAK